MQRQVEIYRLNNKEDVKEFKQKIGIYALLYKDEIIYIGQSSDIEKRLKNHNSSSKIQDTIHKIIKENGECNRSKELALYYFINEHRDEIEFIVLKECLLAELNHYEEKYLLQFKPRFNYKGVVVPYQWINKNAWEK